MHAVFDIFINQKGNRLAIGKAGGNAVFRRFGIEGQPGGASFAHGELRKQQVYATGKIEADHFARAGTTANKFCGDLVGKLVGFSIGECAIRRDDGRGPGRFCYRGTENIGQHFFLQEFCVNGPTQGKIIFLLFGPAFGR